MCVGGSLENMIKKLNKTEYLILRNYEILTTDMDCGEDIDILCSDKKSLVSLIHAFPITPGNNVFNYYIIVKDKKIFIDIREIGDGYYDKKWEQDMLKNRVKFRGFYILDKENYKYSLLYHAVIHKYSISNKYSKKLREMFGDKIGDNKFTDILLCNYMCKKGYSLQEPIDKGVAFNSQNHDRLQQLMKEAQYKK